MRQPILALLILLLIVPAATAQDEKPANPRAIELMALYKQTGRSWSYREIRSIRGESPEVENSTTRVSKLVAGVAECVFESVSADRTRVSMNIYQVDPSAVPEEAKAWAEAGLPDETPDVGFRKFPCKKHVSKTDAVQTTTWVSTEYHPLIVKQVTIEKEITFIRKLTAFSAGDVDPWQLYRKEGRRWKTKTTMTAGGRATVSFTEYKVKEVREESATCALSIIDGAGKVLLTQDMEFRFTPPAAARVAAPGTTLTMESKTVAIGEFECYLSDTNGTKTWTSVQWPSLLVAMSGTNMEMELVEFELGHDEHAFYRTAGNFYVLRQTVRQGETQTESTIRHEVVSVLEGEVTWSTKQTDSAGKEVVNGESTLTLPADAVSVPFAGEIEELIETPAGRLPAIRSAIVLKGETSEGTGFEWTWNGIVVRRETTMGGIEEVTELIELNLQ